MGDGSPSLIDVSLQTGQSLLTDGKVEKKTQLTKQTSTTQIPPLTECHSLMTQTMTSSVPNENTQTQEAIKILKTKEGDHDVIEIATKHVPSSSNQETTQREQPNVSLNEGIMVDMKYQDAKQTDSAMSELNIVHAAPQSFETILVEPDDVITEVVVDADGTKKIIVRKLRPTTDISRQAIQQHIISSSLSTTLEEISPMAQSFSQTATKDQQITVTRTRSDGTIETISKQIYGNRIVTNASSENINVEESEPRHMHSQMTQSQIEDVTKQPHKEEILMEGDKYQTSAISGVHTVVQQVTKRVIKKIRRVIRKVNIIDGKEIITEEVIEEPEEIEVDEQDIPRISINVFKSEEQRIISPEEKFIETEQGEPMEPEIQMRSCTPDSPTQGPFFGPFTKDGKGEKTTISQNPNTEIASSQMKTADSNIESNFADSVTREISFPSAVLANVQTEKDNSSIQDKENITPEEESQVADKDEYKHFSNEVNNINIQAEDSQTFIDVERSAVSEEISMTQPEFLKSPLESVIKENESVIIEATCKSDDAPIKSGALSMVEIERQYDNSNIVQTDTSLTTEKEMEISQQQVTTVEKDIDIDTESLDKSDAISHESGKTKQDEDQLGYVEKPLETESSAIIGSTEVNIPSCDSSKHISEQLQSDTVEIVKSITESSSSLNDDISKDNEYQPNDKATYEVSVKSKDRNNLKKKKKKRKKYETQSTNKDALQVSKTNNDDFPIETAKLDSKIEESVTTFAQTSPEVALLITEEEIQTTLESNLDAPTIVMAEVEDSSVQTIITHIATPMKEYTVQTSPKKDVSSVVTVPEDSQAQNNEINLFSIETQTSPVEVAPMTTAETQTINTVTRVEQPIAPLLTEKKVTLRETAIQTLSPEIPKSFEKHMQTTPEQPDDSHLDTQTNVIPAASKENILNIEFPKTEIQIKSSELTEDSAIQINSTLIDPVAVQSCEEQSTLATTSAFQQSTEIPTDDVEISTRDFKKEIIKEADTCHSSISVQPIDVEIIKGKENISEKLIENPVASDIQIPEITKSTEKIQNSEVPTISESIKEPEQRTEICMEDNNPILVETIKPKESTLSSIPEKDITPDTSFEIDVNATIELSISDTLDSVTSDNRELADSSETLTEDSKNDKDITKQDGKMGKRLNRKRKHKTIETDVQNKEKTESGSTCEYIMRSQETALKPSASDRTTIKPFTSTNQEKLSEIDPVQSSPEPMDTTEESLSLIEPQQLAVCDEDNEPFEIKTYAETMSEIHKEPTIAVLSNSEKYEKKKLLPWEDDSLSQTSFLQALSTPFLTMETTKKHEIKSQHQTNQTTRMIIDRVKNLQNSNVSSHIGKILHIAHLEEVTAKKIVEERSSDVHRELMQLRNAARDNDVITVGETLITVVETISTWLETIEYRIFLNRECPHSLSNKDTRIFVELKDEIYHVKKNIHELDTIWEQAELSFPTEEREKLRECVDALQYQMKIIDDVTVDGEKYASMQLAKWDEFLNGVSSICR